MLNLINLVKVMTEEAKNPVTPEELKLFLVSDLRLGERYKIAKQASVRQI